MNFKTIFIFHFQELSPRHAPTRHAPAWHAPAWHTSARHAPAWHAPTWHALTWHAPAQHASAWRMDKRESTIGITIGVWIGGFNNWHIEV